MADRPLYPTELLGSYALPSWLIALEERLGDLGETDIAEALDDAVNVALFDQERAGVDVVTDGEMRRHDFIQGFYGRLSGLIPLPPCSPAGGYRLRPESALSGGRPSAGCRWAGYRRRGGVPAPPYGAADKGVRSGTGDAISVADIA